MCCTAFIRTPATRTRAPRPRTRSAEVRHGRRGLEVGEDSCSTAILQDNSVISVEVDTYINDMIPAVTSLDDVDPTLTHN